MIKAGWKVIAIDINDTSNIIKENLTKDEIKRLTFICDDVENIEFEKCDLVISFNALSFIDKECIKYIIKKIKKSLNINGIVILNFFGKEDDFKNRQSGDNTKNTV